ncbi:hypothetical protein Taro_045253 [Colocasia esculenta]|uniref:Uncharacterized protein n=1 Tax=Colocasia esculenta TaxID=4460 RepID=A0A843WQS1_COLES|nr:hypothetical protein [Colocasia esculenta]
MVCGARSSASSGRGLRGRVLFQASVLMPLKLLQFLVLRLSLFRVSLHLLNLEDQVPSSGGVGGDEHEDEHEDEDS